MSGSANDQKWFQELLKLVGKEVEIGLNSGGKVLSGIVRNTMFDSFLLESKGQTNIVRFQDVGYLLPKS